jgi:hypothetical protein
MQSFIGCKIVQAEPMSKAAFATSKGRPSDLPDEEGYKIIYPDGYESWSPKAVFEQAYRLISDQEAELVQYKSDDAELPNLEDIDPDTCESESNLGI